MFFRISTKSGWLHAAKSKMLEVAQHLEHTTRVLDMDVTNDEHIERLKKVLADERPVIRMLVNSAGYGIMGDFSAASIKDELGMIDVNCKALTQLTHLCIPYMRKKTAASYSSRPAQPFYLSPILQFMRRQNPMCSVFREH